MELKKLAVFNGIFSILMFLIIIQGAYAQTSSGLATGSKGGSLFLVVTSFGIVYLSSIAWYLNKRSKSSQTLPLDLEQTWESEIDE